MTSESQQAAGRPTDDIAPYLALAIDRGASDIYFTSNAPIMLRIEGQTHPVTGGAGQALAPERIEAFANAIMTPEQQALFRSLREVDFAIRYRNVGRFRVNVFRQRGSVAMVLRNVGKVPELADLDMPPILTDLAMTRRGLVLCVGATGSGKSTTLAAMINHRNANQSGHILTIEDPVEFHHPHRRAIVNQREIGPDTRSYANALRSAMREAPDVVLIGEVRDRDTVEACIQLAGTGHLALSTLHANNAYQTLQRIISLFAEEQREQLFMDLSLNLRAIVSQRLVRGRDGKRIAAMEILVNTPYVADLILKGRIDAVREAMTDTAQGKGMRTFDDSLFELYQSGRIDREVALDHADSRDNLENRIAFDAG
ncbi:PilT/PilU family type 4a pilus ATPase [Spectribacter hydrogenoxidans]|uniref:PilT/PilU family type 4a pilus ATPase n=1 Tax=Spectribacter hydrogenoxidans TaxID=3075608 RepID=A0ABU3BY36_9GAMM|nr:PilT/PilU family type 4a pilus ATPase [Salinisphaera sp. W335]MDT0634203.1 PilT/PilU family type 4a pilus ATPase [Salinisphaera sp. W335]